MRTLKYPLVAVCIMSMTACSVMNVRKQEPVQVYLQEYVGDVPDQFTNLDKPVNVRVEYVPAENDAEQDGRNVLASMTNAMRYRVTNISGYIPAVDVFAKGATENLMDRMGFETSPSADYTLKIRINAFDCEYGATLTYKVAASYALYNEAGEPLGPVGSVESSVKHNKSMTLGEGLGEAWYEAIRKFNWNRIAKLLTVKKTAGQEKNAKVRGNGDTALEHTVIRWNISSRPQGADVTWRVVSSTPDVHNTNSNYVGTTPYESTESFDIKGLTYNNAGNVQIEITCERSGYLTQKKRFNLRQAIDQKEISAMFNLIKDDE